MSLLLKSSNFAHLGHTVDGILISGRSEGGT